MTRLSYIKAPDLIVSHLPLSHVQKNILRLDQISHQDTQIYLLILNVTLYTEFNLIIHFSMLWKWQEKSMVLDVTSCWLLKPIELSAKPC